MAWLMLSLVASHFTSTLMVQGLADNSFHYKMHLHKTQGLTLPFISISLDEQIFAKGQAYVALSRAPSWSSLSITALSHDAFRIDSGIIAFIKLQMLAS